MGNGNKVEMLIAICAVMTSVIALFVAWDQGRVMRAQQHGSVYPVLQVDGFVSVNDHYRSMGINFRNSGVGPALVETVTFLDNGTPIESLVPYREQLPDGYDLSWTGMVGRAVAPGEEISALEVAWPRDTITNEQQAVAAEQWGSLSLVVCYCSVFDRCWETYGLDQTLPIKRVDQCERSERDFLSELGTARQILDHNSPEVE